MTIAIYTRLSLEDGTNQESASIVNQRYLLLDFIRNHPDLYGAKVVEFSDDGYSGKTLTALVCRRYYKRRCMGKSNVFW